MEASVANRTDWIQQTLELGESFSQRAKRYDREGTFVFKNYSDLKSLRYFSAMIPTEFGGGGLSYPDMCQVIRLLAQHCGSTALAFSMHQHLVAATIWKQQQKGIGAETLRKVADQQLVLVSTGARDWLGSNGELKKVAGGYLFSGRKHFASQSAVGDVAVTSAPFQAEGDEWKVLHFSVPFLTDGVKVLDDWKVLGMRATGSQTIVFDDVFIPESAIALERDRDAFHPVWSVVLTVAMPLIMSAYIGIAERAVDLALSIGKKYARNQQHMPYIIGKLYNSLISAQTQWKAMYELTNDLDFTPDEAGTINILSLKTNVADLTIQTVKQAMEAVGGQSFYQKNELERLFRDIQAAQFHPLPKWEQYSFTGKRLLAGTIDQR